MKKRGIPLALGLLAGSLALQAQMPPIPFHQIERESQGQLPPASDFLASASTDGFSSSAIPASAVVPVPRTQTSKPSIVDRHFMLFNGLHLGLALFDVGMTQRCIANHQCREGNPLMPSSMSGQLGVTLGLFAYSTGGSYYLKRRQTRSWWVPPVSGILAHTIGVASGFMVK